MGYLTISTDSFRAVGSPIQIIFRNSRKVSECTFASIFAGRAQNESDVAARHDNRQGSSARQTAIFEMLALKSFRRHDLLSVSRPETSANAERQ
ncbi:MAG TPA: hypothetical protein VIW64_13415 [Pyrinomonadaceae bacterium]|jgi:hypothetical protein